MKCQKCGYEIKEGNEFCTNCGKSVHGKKINKYKIIIISFIILLIIIGAVIVIKTLTSPKQETQKVSINNELVEEKITNTDIDKDNEALIENNDVIKEENDLLKEIEKLNPNNEYIVCYNEYGEYWILDSEGKKIYFNDVDSFKDAVKVCKERANNTLNQSENHNENNTGYQINSSKNNSQQTDVNINESNGINNNSQQTNNKNDAVSNNQEETQVNISDISTKYPKFEDAKKELENRGLKVNEIIKEQNVEFIYSLNDTWKFENYSKNYKKGDTINIIHTIDIPSEAKIRFKVNLSKIINDTKKTPLLTTDENAGHHSKVGVNVYFNNTLAFTYNYYNHNEDKAYEYTLQPNQNVHVKISAPYYSNSEDLTDIQNQEFIISEYDIDTSNFKILYYELYDRVQYY